MASIGYIGVSSIQQNTEFQLSGITLDKCVRRKASGKNIEREQYKAMMNYVQERDTLHARSIDFLCRKTSDLLATFEELIMHSVIAQLNKEGLKLAKKVRSATLY